MHRTTTDQHFEITQCVSGRVHIVLDHQRSVPYTCTIHSIHSCKSTLSGAVLTLRRRVPRRLLAAFRRGIKIGGAECGLAVRDQRSWKRRRGSTSAVSTIGGGGALQRRWRPSDAEKVRSANEGELLMSCCYKPYREGAVAGRFSPRFGRFGRGRGEAFDHRKSLAPLFLLASSKNFRVLRGCLL